MHKSPTFSLQFWDFISNAILASLSRRALSNEAIFFSQSKWFVVSICDTALPTTEAALVVLPIVLPFGSLYRRIIWCKEGKGREREREMGGNDREREGGRKKEMEQLSVPQVN